MSGKINPSDLLNIDFKEKIKEDPRFKQYYDQLDADQKEHVEGFIQDIRDAFLPNITAFYQGLNELSDEERQTFDEHIKKLNS